MNKKFKIITWSLILLVMFAGGLLGWNIVKQNELGAVPQKIDWRESNGILSPTDSTNGLMVGGSTTSTAEFVLDINNGIASSTGYMIADQFCISNTSNCAAGIWSDILGSNWLINSSNQLTPSTTIPVLLPSNATTTGSHYIGGDLTVIGTTNVQNITLVNETVTGNITATGGITANSATTTDTLKVGGTLTAVGESFLTGGARIAFLNATSSLIDTATIKGGTIDNTTIGQTTAALAKFTSATTTASFYFPSGVVMESGNVGIGTTGPSSLLTINNGGTFTLAKGLTFGDGDTGFAEDADDDLGVYVNNSGSFYFTNTARFIGGAGAGPAIINATSNTTTPTIIPNRHNVTTGIAGNDPGNNLSFVIQGSSKMFLDSSGNVGIGTTGPGGKLEIDSSTTTTKGLVLKTTDGNTTNNLTEWQNSSGTSLTRIKPNGYLTVGSYDVNTPFGVYNVDTSTSGWQYLSSYQYAPNPASASTATYHSLDFSVYRNNANLSGAAFVGIKGQLEIQGAGNTLGTAIGLKPRFSTTTSTSTIINAYGVYNDVGINTGTISNFYGYFNPDTAGTITNYYGFYGATNTGGTSTNKYGMYLGNISGASTNNYAIYTNTGKVHFGDQVDVTGNVGIGTTGPTQKLEVNGNALISGNATSTGSLWLGTAGTANNLDLTGGDIYVQDDAEIDGNLFVTGTSTIASTGILKTNRILQVGNTSENHYISDGGDNSAFVVIDKSNAASDASLLLASTGDLKWEIGMAGDNNLFWKKVTGTETDGYTFENVLKMDYDTLRVGIGTEAPSSKMEIASSSPTARVDLRVTNKATTGTDGTSLQLVAENDNHVFYIGTDAGLNGNQNAFLNWGAFGTGIFMDASGNIGINDTSLSNAFEVTGNSLFTGNATTTGSLALTGFNCSIKANGGVLTTDANGTVICDDDDIGVAGIIQTEILKPKFNYYNLICLLGLFGLLGLRRKK